ncbi:MAG: sugar transferase [Hyphomicrobium sp.]
MRVSTLAFQNTADISGPIERDSAVQKVVRFFFNLLALTLAQFATLQLRELLNPFFSAKIDIVHMSRLAPNPWAVLVLWAIASWWVHRARPMRIERAWSDALETGAAAGVAAILVYFFSQSLGADLSRSYVLLFYPVCVVSVFVARLAEHAIFSTETVQGQIKDRTVIVGNRAEARMLAERIMRDGREFLVEGIIVPRRAPAHADDSALEFPLLGATSQLAQIINARKLKRILVLRSAVEESELDEMAAIAERMGVSLDQAVGFATGSRTALRTRCGIHMIEVKARSFSRVQELLKRALDLAIALPTFAILVPALIAICLAIKLTSSGPIFYTSQRVGRGGRHFTFLKFRSMYYKTGGRRDMAGQNQQTGHIFKVKRDPRITPVGAFLRRYSLDELPQLINVIRGDMSLLGPRPLPAEDLDPDGMSRIFSLWASERAKVLPGISGLWQIMGRSDLSFEQMVELDLQYIQNWSLVEDLRILLKTPMVVLRGKGAY